MEVCTKINQEPTDTNSPHTPTSTNNKTSNSNNDGSITRSYMRRIQELRPRRYSQKFMQIRDVFEKEKQSPKFPYGRRVASISLASKLERETLNRFEWTGSPQTYAPRQRPRAKSSSNASTPLSRMKRAAVMHSSLCGATNKVSWLLGGDNSVEGQDESQDGAGEPSMLLNVSEQCDGNGVSKEQEEKVQKKGKEETRLERNQEPKQKSKQEKEESKQESKPEKASKEESQQAHESKQEEVSRKESKQEQQSKQESKQDSKGDSKQEPTEDSNQESMEDSKQESTEDSKQDSTEEPKQESNEKSKQESSEKPKQKPESEQNQHSKLEQEPMQKEPTIQHQSNEVSKAKHEQELHEQLQQLQELQQDQEAQLQQLQIQFQKLHLQEQSPKQNSFPQPPPQQHQQSNQVRQQQKQMLTVPQPQQQLQRKHYVQQQQKIYIKNKYRKPYYARTYSPITPKPLHPHVGMLLTKVGMTKYKAFFEREEIDFQVFRSLSQNELIKLGIFSFDDRTQLARAISLAQNMR